MPSSERSVAKAAGLSRYFTGRVCVAGHVAERLTSNGNCLDCVAIKKAVAYAANPEVARQAVVAWRRKNPDIAKKSSRASHAKRREADKQQSAAWRAANPEKVRANFQAWRQANIESERARAIEWRRENPDRVRDYCANRRARKRMAGGKHTTGQIKELLAAQLNECAICRVNIPSGYHRDHIIPLSRGGSNDIGNIQLLCAPCNQSKYNKMPDRLPEAGNRL